MPASVLIADIVESDGVFLITTFDGAGNRSGSSLEFDCPFAAESALFDAGFYLDPDTNEYTRRA
jgi:hypothetical protein